VHRVTAAGSRLGNQGNVKLFLIGGVVGLALGVGLTVLYFSLATFFEVNAKALDRRSGTVVEGDKYTEGTSDKRKAG